MQKRMREHQLSNSEINGILNTEESGVLSTISDDGYPHSIPLHFIYHADKIYFHCLPKGHKLNNITKNNKVSFTVYNMGKYIIDSNEKPCDTNTAYESIVLTGNAEILTDDAAKQNILNKVVEKYTPQLLDKAIPESMVKSTAVVEIAITKCTGKYYK